ncbi:MAG: VWA domain-containing protein [Bacteroidales bacterium]|nr:VWA domain-containing protein [Bacteroidales bacterium]
MKHIFRLLILIQTNTLLQAQPVSMRLSAETVDFGDIAAVMIPAKTVEFKNVSTERLALLVVEKGPDVVVRYQRRFYEPGEKGLISLSYEPRDLGLFNEKIKIFTNLDDEPYIITLKGNSITIEECFPDKANMNLRNIIAVNKLTQAPVPFAEVSFIHNFNESRPILCKTDRSGKAVKALPTGQYNAQSETEGYEAYNNDFFLPRSRPNILIELNPRKTVPVKPPVVIPEVTPDMADVPEVSSPDKKPVTSRELPEDRYAANNIVLLLDVSSSMRTNSKFTLLQQSVNNLVMALRGIDNVSVITYAGNAQVVINGIPGTEKDMIMGVVQELRPEGITRGVKGLNTAYELAVNKFISGGNNQVILATDGEFSEKNVTDEYYRQFITGYAGKGIKLSILGFGVNEEAISRMKKMASYGDGRYIHISSEKYVKDVLIDEIKAMSFMGE